MPRVLLHCIYCNPLCYICVRISLLFGTLDVSNLVLVNGFEMLDSLMSCAAGLEASQQVDLFRLLRLATDTDSECMRAAVAQGPISSASSNGSATDSGTHYDDIPRNISTSGSGTGSLQLSIVPSRQRAHTLPTIESVSLASSMSLGKDFLLRSLLRCRKVVMIILHVLRQCTA